MKPFILLCAVLAVLQSSGQALADTSALFKTGVMAVSVERAVLVPGEATNLFVIRERGSHD